MSVYLKAAFREKKQMNKQESERIITEYIKPVFGFALKRCRSLQDAEDLSQEIISKAFHALMKHDAVKDAGKFIWTVAHNALSNYYRDVGKNCIGVSFDEISEYLCDSTDIESKLSERETVQRLQSEIAYLSKLQRRIVIDYYYGNKKQNKIAEELNIPVGTVKWHLFEAKKELKRGMGSMRISSELKFNPVRFDICGTNGIIGSKGNNDNFFKSALSQNIVYSVWREGKTVNQIADDLGVSPVYVESEAEYLEKYNFLIKSGEKYLCNILIDEMTPDITELHDEMYEKAAKIFADELYNELVKSKIWENPNTFGGHTGDISFDSSAKKDKNFFLWALIPFITASSGENLSDKAVSFEEAATIRPDGGQNICYANVSNGHSAFPKHFESIKLWKGPFQNGINGFSLWQIDTEWSEKRIDDDFYQKAPNVLNLLKHWFNGNELTAQEIAFLVERGFLKTAGEPDQLFKCALQCVCIKGEKTKKSLIYIGETIMKRHKDEFAALRGPYEEAVLRNTPEHLQKMQQYCLQYTFYYDAWFILYCLKELVGSGKLNLPTEEQKKALTTIIIDE